MAAGGVGVDTEAPRLLRERTSFSAGRTAATPAHRIAVRQPASAGGRVPRATSRPVTARASSRGAPACLAAAPSVVADASALPRSAASFHPLRVDTFGALSAVRGGNMPRASSASPAPTVASAGAILCKDSQLLAQSMAMSSQVSTASSVAYSLRTASSSAALSHSGSYSASVMYRSTSHSPRLTFQLAGDEEEEDLIHQHVLYYLRHSPEAASTRTVRRVSSGVYDIDGQQVDVEWQHHAEVGQPGHLVVVDGPLRQPFGDYLLMNETNAEYDTHSVAFTSALHSVPKERRMTFDDTNQKYSRLEAMRVAKEQASIREKAADYTRSGHDVPDDLVKKYNKALRQKLRKAAPITGEGSAPSLLRSDENEDPTPNVVARGGIAEAPRMVKPWQEACLPLRPVLAPQQSERLPEMSAASPTVVRLPAPGAAVSYFPAARSLVTKSGVCSFAPSSGQARGGSMATSSSGPALAAQVGRSASGIGLAAAPALAATAGPPIVTVGSSCSVSPASAAVPRSPLIQLRVVHGTLASPCPSPSPSPSPAPSLSPSPAHAPPPSQHQQQIHSSQMHPPPQRQPPPTSGGSIAICSYSAVPPPSSRPAPSGAATTSPWQQHYQQRLCVQPTVRPVHGIR